MIWKKITIETLNAATDIVASVLFDNGIIGAEIEDNQNLSDNDLKKMYVDIPLDRKDNGISKVIFYVAIVNNKESLINNNLSAVSSNIVDNSYKMSTDNIFTEEEFKEIFKRIMLEIEDYKEFMELGTLKISEDELDDNVLLNKWKENFKEITVNNIKIFPSWQKEIEDSDSSLKNDLIKIYIDPGAAFGTGKHPTTKLCIKAIDEIAKEKSSVNSMLDIGSGSGILGIVAMKLCVKRVFAIDVDESVESNLLDNLALNSINSIIRIDKNTDIGTHGSREAYIYGFGNIITDKELRDVINCVKYDIITINILAPVVITLLEKCEISSYLNRGGILILSGIIKDKEKDVADTIKRDRLIKKYDTKYEDDWVMFKCYI